MDDEINAPHRILAIRSRMLAEIREDWNVPILNESYFKVDTLVSHEWRSTLHSGTFSQDGAVKKQVVVKIFNRQTAGKVINVPARVERLYQYYKRECGIWRNIGSHQNIVQILGVMESFQGSIFPAVIMPFYQHKDLRSLVQIKTGMSQNTRASLMYEVAKGLQYLHGLVPPLVHRDIKGSNILVHEEDGKLVAKISDFGSAKFSFASEYDMTATTRVAVLDWTSPELVEEKLNDKLERSTPLCASDMWSFACTFLEALTACNPWGKAGCSLSLLLSGHHPDRPHDVGIDDVYWSLMTKCWRAEPTDRLTAEDVRIFLRSLKLSA